VIASANANLGTDGSTITFTGSAKLNTTHSAYPTLAKGVTVNNGVTATINEGSQYYKMTFTGPLSGSGTLYFSTGASGAGSELKFTSDANTFSGTVQVAMVGNGGGGLFVNSLPDSANPIKLTGNANSAIFGLNTGTASPLLFNSRRIELNGTAAGGGYIQNNNATPGNTITINTDLMVSATGNKTLTLGGSNTGNNTFGGAITNGVGATISLTKADAGKWILSGNNTYTGSTTINAGGKLEIGGAGVLGGGNYAGSIVNNGTWFRVASSANQTFSGVISGNGPLIKDSSGTLTLSNVNTYIGATIVSNGTLRVNGSTHSSSAVTVNTGGTLGGTGIINALATIASGATLAPGAASPDTLTLANGLNLAGGSSLSVELGTSPDLIDVTGGTFTCPAAGTVAVNISEASGFGPGFYTVIDWTGATSAVSVNLADFTLSMPGSWIGELSIVGNKLMLEVRASGSVFRFR